MSQPLRVLIPALLEIGLGLWVRGAPGAIVLYIGLTTLAVSASMALGYTGLLGKRTSDGKLSAWRAVVFWPWHLLAWSSMLLQRGVLREDPMTEVHPGWWLAAWPHEPEAFDEWPAVLDMTAELPRWVEPPAYLCLPTWDGTAVRPQDLERAGSYLAEQREAGREVLVHCAHGHSRSAAAMAAGLVRAGVHSNWEEALDHMARERQGVGLNRSQREGMRQWAARG